MQRFVSARLWAVAEGQGAALQPPFNVTNKDAVERVRDFIQRAMAVQDPSDLRLPPMLSDEGNSDESIQVILSLRRLPTYRMIGAATTLCPGLTVRRVGQDILEIDFE